MSSGFNALPKYQPTFINEKTTTSSNTVVENNFRPDTNGNPFVVYDYRELEDRSESTWVYCNKCNQTGMSVLKLAFSCSSLLRWYGVAGKSHELLHACQFCDSELGRRKNGPGVCCTSCS